MVREMIGEIPGNSDGNSADRHSAGLGGQALEAGGIHDWIGRI
jgi:hypothetical protein